MKKGRWSKKEENFLKKNYPQLNDRKLAQHLGRSVNAVEHKRRTLGLTGRSKEREVDIDALVEEEKDKQLNAERNKLLKKLIGQKAQIEIISSVLKDVVPNAKYSPKSFKPAKENGRKEEVMMINLGDVHFGRYTVEDARKKANTLFEGITRLADIHRSAHPVNHLVVNLLGDIVDGDSIFPGQPYEQKYYLMEQMFTYGMPILVDLFNRLSDHFKDITIYAVPGNHGRVSKWTDKELNFDTIFYEACKLATKDNPKIKWNITWNWYQIANVLGWKFFLSHGANIRTWMNLPFYGMKEKGMRWQGSLPKGVNNRAFNYMIMGHFHTNLSFAWNDFEAYINGTWLEQDRFAEEQLGLRSKTSQTMFGITKKRGIVWVRPIDLRT